MKEDVHPRYQEYELTLLLLQEMVGYAISAAIERDFCCSRYRSMKRSYRVVDVEDEPIPDWAPDDDEPLPVIPDDDAPVPPDVPEELDEPPNPVEDDAPVEPDAPEELDVPPAPVDGVEVEPPDAPMLEPLDVLPLPDDDDGELVELAEEGPIEPCAEPAAEPMPDAEPVAEPLALGPLVEHAASANAHAKGNNNFFIKRPF